MMRWLAIVPAVLLTGAAWGASVTPVFVEGNPSCTDLGYSFGFKIDPPNAGTYDVYPGNSVTVTTDGVNFDWTSTFGVDAVIAKGGPNANVYVYDPPAESFGDTGLHSPINDSNGQPFGLSHIEFCYDFEVVVTKTADTTFTRTWQWTIEKTGSTGPAITPVGSIFTASYEVTVDASSTDSNWAVSGTISVFNPAPVAATITGVTDNISGFGDVAVDCGVTFPYVLAAGGTLNCTYSSALPDGSNRTNTATATTSGAVGGDSGSADATFGSPTTETDECIDVSDSAYGNLGIVCADEAPKTFTYDYDWTQTVDTCQGGSFDNTASFVTNDTGATGESSWSIPIDQDACEDTGDGCSLTQGYWKTHSEFGPAPYDDTWALLGPSGASTPFYSSGKTYYEVLWTAPHGNVYYQLAHQFIAATLNGLNGADLSSITAAMAYANTFFSTYTPTSTLSNAVKNAARAAATTLDNYNNGLIGPGHCSE